MKIVLLGCKGTTLDLLNDIVTQDSFKIDQVITLPEEVAEKNRVAYYCGPEIIAYCQQRSIPVHIVNSYPLKDTEDLHFFKRSAIDLLIVIGWERLVPSEVLVTLDKFACGMHGSPFGMPRGRGRSPLNWSLITGRKKFLTYLFRYDPYVDSGDIIGVKAFDINEFDTIASLHMKNRIAMGQLLRMYIPLIEKREVTFVPQPPESPTYYPKRTPDDSGIDWRLSTGQIYDLIRAVSKPYPPAYTYHRGVKIFILEAFPFDTDLFHSSIKPGTIVDVSVSLQQFVLKTIDGALLVKKFDGAHISELEVGDVLEGVSQADILQQVIQRYHQPVPEDQMEVRPPLYDYSFWVNSKTHRGEKDARKQSKDNP